MIVPDDINATVEPNPALDTACEVWIGSSKTSDNDPLRLDELDEKALSHRDGIGIVYMPLIPNEKSVPGFNPFSVSTWRRELTPTESQNLLDVAEVRWGGLNFDVFTVTEFFVGKF